MFKGTRNLLTAFVVVSTALAGASALAATQTEEQRLIGIARNLKPISDTQWNEIAGSKSTETYDIQKGDTLWDVSKRLFGNAYYWPKVWALNAGISNPHIVAPGQKLAFIPGSSESTPKLSNAAPSAGAAELQTTTAAAKTTRPEVTSPSSGSHEYDKIPRDMWAPVEASKDLKKNYDDYGLDKELKIVIPSRFVFRVPAIANDTTIPYLGEIVGSRREGVGLSQHETVFLKSNSQDLQVGTTYSIFADPEYVHERKSDRSGYIYKTIGEIKVVGVKDELYVAVITAAYDVIERGARVYPLLPLVSDMKPQPARTALESLVLMSTVASTRNTSQFRFVHFDRGIEDGVQVGNVFRLYDYYDPQSRGKLTDSDFLVNADVLVVHSTAQFSTGIVLRSRETFTRGDFGVLLTDVSDLEKQVKELSHGFGENDEKRTPEDKELDELDELDKSSGEGLGKKEETEIKELDQWDKVKDFQAHPNTEPTEPSDANKPTDEEEKLPDSGPTKVEISQPESEGVEHTLDETLDSPSASPKGQKANGIPSAPQPDQTLDAPPPPLPDGQMPESLPDQPMTPGVEPIQQTAPDDIEQKSN